MPLPLVRPSIALVHRAKCMLLVSGTFCLVMAIATAAIAKRSCDDDASFDKFDEAVTELEVLLDETERGLTPVLVGTEDLVADLTHFSECGGTLGRRALFYLARLHGLRGDDLEERRAVIRLRARPLLSPEEEKELDKHYPSAPPPPEYEAPQSRPPTAYDSDDHRDDDPGPTAEERAEARRARFEARQRRLSNNPLFQRGAGFELTLGGRAVSRQSGPFGVAEAERFKHGGFVDFGVAGVFQLELLRLVPRVNFLYASNGDSDSDDNEVQVGVGVETLVGVGFQTGKLTPYIGARLGFSSLGSLVAGWEGGIDINFGVATLGFYGGTYLDPSMFGGAGGVKIGVFSSKPQIKE